MAADNDPVRVAERAIAHGHRLVGGLARRAWPVLERVARRSTDRDLDILWSDTWTPAHDAALDEVGGITSHHRQQFRVLGAPNSSHKCHAIVRYDGATAAVVSLRRRPFFWEPVSEQCIPGAPIACTPELMGKVLNGLGVEIRFNALEFDPTHLAPQQSYPFPRYGADLTRDWQEHWPTRGGMNYREARKKTRGLDVRIDHPGDVEWTVRQWAVMWAEDATGEVAAADDRTKLWTSLGTDTVHSVVLVDGAEPVAGCVHFVVDDTANFMCTARDARYDKRRVGTRVLDLSFEWAADAGLRTIDLGGGLGTHYKHWWAPEYATSYGGIFRPRLLHAVRSSGSWANAQRRRLANRTGRSMAVTLPGLISGIDELGGATGWI